MDTFELSLRKFARNPLEVRKIGAQTILRILLKKREKIWFTGFVFICIFLTKEEWFKNNIKLKQYNLGQSSNQN